MVVQSIHSFAFVHFPINMKANVFFILLCHIHLLLLLFQIFDSCRMSQTVYPPWSTRRKHTSVGDLCSYLRRQLIGETNSFLACCPCCSRHVTVARGQQLKQRATMISPWEGGTCFSASGQPWCLLGRQQCPTLWRSTPGRSPWCCDERPLAAPQPDTSLSIASGKRGAAGPSPPQL